MLTKKQVESIKWYKQSGAGIPLCIEVPLFVISKRIYKKCGLYFPNDVLICLKSNNGLIFYHYFDYYLTLKEVEKMFKHLEDNDGFFEKLKKDFYPSARKMEKIGLDILDEKVTSIKFTKKYERFLECSMKFWENSLFVDLLDPFESQIIDFIFDSNKEKIDKKDLNVLLSPDKLSIFQEEQKDILKIYEIAKKEGSDSLKVKKMIKDHSNNYYWLKNDYEKVECLDEKYFYEILNKLLNNSSEVGILLNGLKKFEETKKNKTLLIGKYKLNEKSIEYLNFFNWVTSYRDDRKKYNQISNYILIKIIEKISDELGIDTELLKYSLHNEIMSVIKKDDKVLSEIKKRKEGLVSFSQKTTEPKTFSGSIAKEYFDIIEKTITASEIKGTTASPGKAIGTAKIILNQSDFSKMENGDVIVASMTRPEYVSIMKMASAIVTDEGGITCHAAIVSRELNIPCITGTQIASRSIKDGDLIDVNADHGLVKIIKKA